MHCSFLFHLSCKALSCSTMNIQASKSVLIAIEVKANEGTKKIGNQAVLDGKRVKHLLYLPDAAKSPDGLSNLQNNNSIYISLRDDKNTHIHDLLPVSMLNHKNQNVIEMNADKIVWEKSEISISDNAAIPAGSCVMFLAIYE